MSKLISIVIPIFNEEKNIPVFFAELEKVVSGIQNYRFELIFVDDGSTDRSGAELGKLADRGGRDSNLEIRIIEFTRNFGKEAATSAGIDAAGGDACILIDSDLQHPPGKIPEMIEKWQKGAEVVVGIRKSNESAGIAKTVGSGIFYFLINRISDTKVVPGATDFRLLDRVVIDEFKQLKERNRMTRALIDWMGFDRGYVFFDARPRLYGQPAYNLMRLARLALNSMVSLSFFPLRVAGYLGIILTLVAGTIGAYMFFQNYVLHEVNYSGPAILAVINLFSIGIVLISLGLIALYIANIHIEAAGRPMYVVRKRQVRRDG